MRSGSESETMALGTSVAACLEEGSIVALIGDLGAGKTHFVKGVALAFGVAPADVSSPTFTIAHEYAGESPVYHLDLYRLAGPEEVQQAGIHEYFDAAGICLVEWPERAGHLIPETAIVIRMTHQDDGTRLVELIHP